MTFNSVYEITNNLSTIAGQHFIECFTGSSLDSKRWGVREAGSSSTFGMDDSVNGGFKISNVAESNNQVAIGFCADGSSAVINSVRPFNHAGCEAILVMKFDSTSGNYDFAGAGGGFSKNVNLSAGGSDCCLVNVNAYEGQYYALRTSDSSGSQSCGSACVSSVALDANYHVFKLRCGGGTTSEWVDGILGATNSDRQPTEQMGMNFSSSGDNSNTTFLNIAYCEAWNTA